MRARKKCVKKGGGKKKRRVKGLLRGLKFHVLKAPTFHMDELVSPQPMSVPVGETLFFTEESLKCSRWDPMGCSTERNASPSS